MSSKSKRSPNIHENTSTGFPERFTPSHSSLYLVDDKPNNSDNNNSKENGEIYDKTIMNNEFKKIEKLITDNFDSLKKEVDSNINSLKFEIQQKEYELKIEVINTRNELNSKIDNANKDNIWLKVVLGIGITVIIAGFSGLGVIMATKFEQINQAITNQKENNSMQIQRDVSQAVLNQINKNK